MGAVVAAVRLRNARVLPVEAGVDDADRDALAVVAGGPDLLDAGLHDVPTVLAVHRPLRLVALGALVGCLGKLGVGLGLRRGGLALAAGVVRKLRVATE